MRKILKSLIGRTIYTCNDMGSNIQERKIVGVSETQYLGKTHRFPILRFQPEIFIDWGNDHVLSCSILIHEDGEIELDRQHSFTLDGIREKSDKIYLGYDKNNRKEYFRYEGQKNS